MSARVLVVGCGFPQLGLVQFCRAEGLEVVGLDQRQEAPAVSLCQRWARVSTVDTAGIVEAGRAHRVEGIVTCGSEAALLPVARAARALGLPFYATPELLESFALKHDMRQRYQAGGAPCPPFAVVRSLEQVLEFARREPSPWVIKPSRGWGQRGVRIVMQEQELLVAAREALAMSALASGGEPTAVVEGFIAGKEYSVNATTVDGHTEVLAVTERIITGYPEPPGITFAEVYPSELSARLALEVEAAAIAGVRALGITRGPSYTQVRAGEQGAALIETAHRLGGGLDPDVTFLASGVSLYRRLLGVALSRPDWERAGPEAEPWGGAVGRFIIARPGLVRSVEGLEQARGLPGVRAAHVFVQPGQRVEPLTDGSKRAGCVLAVGRDRQEAEQAAARAMEVIQIHTGA